MLLNIVKIYLYLTLWKLFYFNNRHLSEKLENISISKISVRICLKTVTPSINIITFNKKLLQSAITLLLCMKQEQYTSMWVYTLHVIYQIILSCFQRCGNLICIIFMWSKIKTTQLQRYLRATLLQWHISLCYSICEFILTSIN